MTEKLSEMTLEELWRLFPIRLTEHQAHWKDWYQEEASELLSLLPGDWVRGIYHIGSTAVEAIWAKPIVDILVELSSDCCLKRACEILCTNGWTCMSRTDRRISLNKGYTDQGFAKQVFHLHLRYEGDKDELYFRDYLREHPEAARAYEQLKLQLWKQYEYNRDGYTEAKTNFVHKITTLAKQESIRHAP